jgi:hypothetical protein
MENIDALASCGFLKLEVASPLIHFPEDGIFADAPAHIGLLKLVDHRSSSTQKRS